MNPLVNFLRHLEGYFSGGAQFFLTLILLALPAMAVEQVAPIQSASEYDYPPFSIVASDGKADGFAVELMREALHAMGREVQFKVGPWHEIKQELAEGRIQALPLVARTAGRDALYDFTSPYLSMHGAVVVRKGDFRIRRAEDLRDKTVVVMQGDIAEEYVLQHHLSDKIATTKTLEEALRQLAAGQHDAMVVQALAGENLIRSLGLSNLETVGPPLNGYQDFCFAVRDGDKELLATLNEGLALVIADGTRERLREKWITPTRDERFSYIRNIIAVVLGTLLLAGLAAYLWLHSLQAQVKARTRELADAIANKDEEIRIRQYTENALTEIAAKAKRFSDALDSIASTYVYMKDLNHQYFYANKATLKLFKCSDEELMGSGDAKFFPPEAVARLKAVDDRVLESGATTMEEIDVSPGNPERRVYLEVKTPICDGAGKIIGLCGISTDITERKQIEEALRESENRLLAILDATPFPIALVDVNDNNIFFWSRSALNLFGHTAHTAEEWYQIAYPDPDYRQEVSNRWKPYLEKAQQSPHAVNTGEYLVTCHDGSVLICELYAAFLQDRLIVTFNDITERKQAELKNIALIHRNQVLMQSTSEGIHILDEQGNIIEANEAFCHHLGYTMEEVLQLSVFDFDAKLNADELRTNLKGLLNDQAIFESVHRRKDGTLVDVELNISGVDIDGRKCLFSLCRDITERKHAEVELLRSNAELEQFSYAVSHDMRQPLRMISSYLQLLEIKLADQLDGEKREYFDYAIEGAKRIDQMLMALLEYSRVGRMGEPPTWIDSRAVLDEALLFLQPAIKEAQAKLNISGDWVQIFASHDEMVRLFQNLIGNATKYRIAGRTPEITITGEVINNEWHLCVADNGVGIIPNQINRLFKVFQRLHSHAAYEGTGIGLALCRKIVEHHKGRIWAESEGEGHGSKFCIALPVLRGED